MQVKLVGCTSVGTAYLPLYAAHTCCCCCNFGCCQVSFDPELTRSNTVVDNVSINLFSSRVKELEEKNKALEEKLEENKEKWWALGKFTTDCGLCPH